MQFYRDFQAPIQSVRVAITGNRLLIDDDVSIIRNEMIELMTSNIEAIYFGGAVGADTVALAACLSISMVDRPQLIVVVPNRLQDQPKSTYAVSKRADQIIELNMPITIGDGYRSYHNRNEYMVDHAHRVVGFVRKNQLRGGAYATMLYTQKMDKNFKPVFLSEL